VAHGIVMSVKNILVKTIISDHLASFWREFERPAWQTDTHIV